MEETRSYVAIDLKSFYASVECVERGLDPLATHLVVADASRTDKTVCLAVTPSLKSYGISGRARLYQVEQRVQEVNAQRRSLAPGRQLEGSSHFPKELAENPKLALSYLVAQPRMAYYIQYSSRIYQIYLEYIAPEDIHVYSIDEVFLDVTAYLKTYHMTARELAMTLVREVYQRTGITATAGIGTNLYLCKVAMDIVAKHMEPDENGVRLAELDEESYRRLLWGHRPLTDFWRVGKGYAQKLEKVGLYTMGDIARCSMGRDDSYYNENLLYKLFGVNAELLIDHAWGWEPCTIADIKAYRPQSNSLSSGQVLSEPYPVDKARLIVQEMADQMALGLVDKGLVCDQLTLHLGYDVSNLTDPQRRAQYKGEVKPDFYGRPVPKPSHGSVNLSQPTSSGRLLTQAATELFDRIVQEELLLRRVTLGAMHVQREEALEGENYQQLSLFGEDLALQAQRQQEEQEALEREKRQQQAILQLNHRFGKNTVLKGMNLKEGATTISRNRQIGGHKA